MLCNAHDPPGNAELQDAEVANESCEMKSPSDRKRVVSNMQGSGMRDKKEGKGYRP